MKAKKILAGVLAGTMMAAVSVGTWSASAASTPTLLVSSTTSTAGGSFSVSVSMEDVPSGGINSLDFAISYDSSVLTIQSVALNSSLQSKLSGDSTITSTTPALTYEIYDDEVDISFSTMTDASSCITDNSTIFTISGTVSESAADGTVSTLSIIPISRTQNSDSSAMNTTIEAAAVSASGGTVYEVNVQSGTVTVSSSGSNSTLYLLGDVNLDGSINLSDVVLLSKSFTGVELSEQQKLNGDCYDDGTGMITSDDVVQLLRYNVGLTSLPVKAY